MRKKFFYQSEIKIPQNVKIEKKDNILFFEGPLGCNKLHLKNIDSKGSIALHIKKDLGDKNSIVLTSCLKSTYGSIKNLIKNKIYGVSQGYLLYLQILGIGYRCFLENNTLRFKVGKSHDVYYQIPNSIRIFLVEPTRLCLFSLDKNQVTQIAAGIRGIRPPSPYKGKGIRFLEEKVRIKQGKQK